MNTKLLVLVPIVLTIAINTLNAKVVTTTDQISILQAQKNKVNEQIQNIQEEQQVREKREAEGYAPLEGEPAEESAGAESAFPFINK